MTLSKLLRVNRSIDFTVCAGINKFRYVRCYSTYKEKGLTQRQERAEVSRDVRPLGEKIKETSKTVSYTGIILVGLGVTGIIFYYVFRELFSSNSPNSIYSVALEKCKNDPRIEDALGSPIKGYGEETTRRRRTRVSHAVYEKDGVKHMRMRFYIKGIRNKGVAELDMKQTVHCPVFNLNFKFGIPIQIPTQMKKLLESDSPNEYGNYECRYLLVQLDDYSGKTFIIEDNRAFLDHTKSDVGAQLPTLTLTQ